MATDVQHRVGPTYENYAVEDPEPGVWTVELYGARVAAAGEETRLDVYQAPARNQVPSAAVSISEQGRTVTVDATRSVDPDGTVIDYLWEFGDGSTASGPRATHTYTDAEQFLVTLSVRDDDGGYAFASAEDLLTIPRYEFAGFHGPLKAAPQETTVRAGRSVPLIFGLGGDYGLGVIQDGAPTVQRVDCATGAPLGAAQTASSPGDSGLAYDPVTARYTWPWQTLSAWRGTCQTLVLTLDDGSTHGAALRFR